MFRPNTTFGQLANSMTRQGSSGWSNMTGSRGFHQIWPNSTAPPADGPNVDKKDWMDGIRTAYFLPKTIIDPMKKATGKDTINTMWTVSSAENASIIQRRKDEAANGGTGDTGMGQDPGIDPSQNRILEEELQRQEIMDWTEEALLDTGKEMAETHGISSFLTYSGLAGIFGPDGKTPVKVFNYDNKEVNQAVNFTVHAVTVIGEGSYSYKVFKNVVDEADGIPVGWGYEWPWGEKRTFNPESKLHPAAKGDGSDGRTFTSVTIVCGDVNNLESLEYNGTPIDIGRADFVLNPSTIPVSGSTDRAGTAVMVQPGYQRMSQFERVVNTNYEVIPLDKLTGKDGQALAGGSFISQLYTRAAESGKAVYDGTFGWKSGSGSLFKFPEKRGETIISTPGPIKLPQNPKDFAEFLRDPSKYINKDPKKPGEGGQDPDKPSGETEAERLERERQEREREEREREERERERREREGKALRAEAATLKPFNAPILLASVTSNNGESENIFNALDQEVDTYDPPFILPGLTVQNTTSLAQASSVTSELKIKDNFLLTHRLVFHPTGIKSLCHFIICRLINPSQALKGAYYHTLYLNPFSEKSNKLKWHVDGFTTLPPPIQNALSLVGKTLAEGIANPEADFSTEKRLLRDSLLLHSSPDTQEKVTTYSTSTSLSLGGNIGAFGMSPTGGADVSYSMSSSKGTEVPSVSITNHSNTQTAVWQFVLDQDDSAASTSTFQPVVQYVLRTGDDGKGPRSNLPEKKGEEVVLEVATVSLEPPDLSEINTGGTPTFAHPVRVTVGTVRLRRPPVPVIGDS
ncbi:hypothetical protein OQA88_7892 [Cercophora sp. LCS_1]